MNTDTAVDKRDIFHPTTAERLRFCGITQAEAYRMAERNDLMRDPIFDAYYSKSLRDAQDRFAERCL